MLRKLFCFLVASAATLFGQSDANTITITATRSIVLPRDQAVIEVRVNTPADFTLQDVLSLLKDSGITSAHLSNLTDTSQRFVEALALNWTFEFPAPLAKITDTLKTFAALEKAINVPGGSSSMTYAIVELQSSSAGPTCVEADLVADARTQAQKLASAARVTLGQVLEVGGNGVPLVSETGRWFSTAAFGARLGAELPAIYCSLTVKFSFTR